MLRLLLRLSPLFLFASFVFAEIEPIEREVYLMGTSLRIALYEGEREKGLQDLESLIRTVEEAEEQLSTWRPSSELSRINQLEILHPHLLSPSLCELMVRIGDWVRLTGGTFDPGVGPLLKIWGAQSESRLPDPTEITLALEVTGFRHLRVNGCRIHKTKAVVLDAGAFGKGEALNRALAVAEKNHFGPLSLNFGGQVALRNISSEITLADPVDRSKSSSVVIRIRSGSLATSAQSERKGHLLDPRTGYPVEPYGSVTVWHEDALAADILSTALFVMGPKEGYEWATKSRVAACFLISNKGALQVHRTPMFHILAAHQAAE